MDFGKETKDFGNVSQSADGILQTIGRIVNSSLSFVEPVNYQSDTEFPSECYSNYIELDFVDEVRKDIENNRLPTQVGNSLSRLQSQYGGQSQLQVRAPCIPSIDSYYIPRYQLGGQKYTDLRGASEEFRESPISLDGLLNLPEGKKVYVYVDAKGKPEKSFSVRNVKGVPMKVCLLEQFIEIIVRDEKHFPIGITDWRNFPISSKENIISFIKSKFHFVWNEANKVMDEDPFIEKLLNKKWRHDRAKRSSETGRS